MKHNPFKELFTGERNVFTVTIVLVGGYLIAYPLVELSLEHLGEVKTMLLGFVIVIFGNYLTHAFHEDKK